MSIDQAAGVARPQRMSAGTKFGLIYLAVGLVAAVGIGLYGTLVLNKDDVDNAKVGNCAQDAPDKDQKVRLVGCADPGAKYKVLAVQRTSGGCSDVAGASSSVTTDDHIVCLGEKGVDPAKAINVAKEGDCVDLDPSEPQRVACTAKEADHKVLKRVENVLDFQADGACHSVRGSDKSYSWDWKGDSALSAQVDGLTVDVVLCFGPLR